MTNVITVENVTNTLRGDHPWIPGAIFIANPGLAEFLADKIEEFVAHKAQVTIRPCYHPLSCMDCAVKGRSCEKHFPGEDGHEVCTGR